MTPGAEPNIDSPNWCRMDFSHRKSYPGSTSGAEPNLDSPINIFKAQRIIKHTVSTVSNSRKLKHRKRRIPRALQILQRIVNIAKGKGPESAKRAERAIEQMVLIPQQNQHIGKQAKARAGRRNEEQETIDLISDEESAMDAPELPITTERRTPENLKRRLRTEGPSSENPISWRTKMETIDLISDEETAIDASKLPITAKSSTSENLNRRIRTESLSSDKPILRGTKYHTTYSDRLTRDNISADTYNIQA